MKVYYRGNPLKIKKQILVRVCGHPVLILDRPTLRSCLELQAINRSLLGKRRETNGFKVKELAALSAR